MTSEVQAGGPTQAIRYPDPPGAVAGRRFGLVGALRVFGPGAIIASITIGSGEMIFSARGGAVFSYAIIWTLVIAAIAKVAMVYSTNRYMVVTGEHPMHRWAVLFPGPKGWFPLLFGVIAIIAFPSWTAGLSVALGGLVASITVGTGQLWATGLLLAAGLLAWFGTYDHMEKAQTVIVGFMLLAVAVSVFVLRPDWLGGLGGLVPQAPDYVGWLRADHPDVVARPVWLEIATYLGAIGGGVYDYIGYTGMLREKRWGILGRRDSREVAERFLALPKGEQLPLNGEPEEVRKARVWARAPLGDAVVSFTAVAIFAIMFAVNGASLLHEQHQVPAEADTLTYQAQFLTTIHPAMQYLYYVAVFFAFFGSIYGFWELYSYTAYETLGAVFPRIRAAGQPAVRKYLYPYIAVASLFLVWTVGELVAIVTPASILGGVLGCGIFCLAILWTEKRMLPRQYRLSTAGWWYVLLSGLLLTALGVISTWELFA
ncbi:MAG: hypothetical protein GEV03_18375 [Streptosporangiales bacterium]|nr:hypothetical protein [Streptosporangiales bacterium]